MLVATFLPRVLFYLSGIVFFGSMLVLGGFIYATRFQRRALERLRAATEKRRAEFGESRGLLASLGLFLAEQLHGIRMRLGGGGESSSLPDRIRQAGFRGSTALDAYVAAACVPHRLADSLQSRLLDAFASGRLLSCA